jgi:RNA polymerase sigma factor (sigma-70 family)
METFEEFARSRSDGLVRLCFVLSGRHEDAEDLAQETLLTVHRNWRKVQTAEFPDAYVRRIALNLHLSRARRPEPRLVGLDQAAGLASPEAPLGDETGLRRLVAKLPVRQRTVLVLRFYLGLSTAEIAHDLHIRESSVRSALVRAQQTLRGQLTPEREAEIP